MDKGAILLLSTRAAFSCNADSCKNGSKKYVALELQASESKVCHLTIFFNPNFLEIQFLACPKWTWPTGCFFKNYSQSSWGTCFQPNQMLKPIAVSLNMHWYKDPEFMYIIIYLNTYSVIDDDLENAAFKRIAPPAMWVSCSPLCSSKILSNR